ncbi:MAG: ABC transporter permease [Candidatus Njordarchaeia archaeon]
MFSFTSLIVLGYKNIKRKKVRTFLSIFGIILGVLLYTSMSIVTVSFERDIKSSLSYLEGALLIQSKNAPTPVISIIDRNVEFYIRENLSQYIIDVSPQIWFMNGSKFSMRSLIVLGVFPENEINVGGYLKYAKMANNTKLKNNDTGWIVLGDSISRFLGIKIGDEISLGSPPKNVTLKVIGIFKTGGFFDFIGIASIIDIAKIDPFRDLTHTISSIAVKLKDPRDSIKFVNLLEQKFYNIDVIMEKDLISSASSVLDSIEKFAFLVGTLALMIGVLGVMNAMFMNVSERRKEIGILKATGWSNNEVIAEIFFEAVIMGFIGTVIGIIIGIAALHFVLDLFGLKFKLTYSLNDLFGPILMGLLISVIAALPPAWRAINISPIESLRE